MTTLATRPYPCTCGCAEEDHGHDDENPGSTACTNCGDCISYEADPSAFAPEPRTLVRQRHETDCGVAALAMLTRKPYEDALETLFPAARRSPRRRTWLTSFSSIRAGLAALGARGGATTTWRAWADLRDKVGIVRVYPTRPAGEPRPRVSHWLVFEPHPHNPEGLALLDPIGACYHPADPIVRGYGWRPTSFMVAEVA